MGRHSKLHVVVKMGEGTVVVVVVVVVEAVVGSLAKREETDPIRIIFCKFIRLNSCDKSSD